MRVKKNMLKSVMIPLTWFLCLWWWSNSTRFLVAGRKSLGFSISIEIDLVFEWVVDIDLISVVETELT